MDKQEIIKNIALRTGGDIYLGVVGAVRTGKSTFIKNFDIISINMAKNQMLSLNIPKLSGQCGKELLMKLHNHLVEKQL